VRALGLSVRTHYIRIDPPVHVARRAGECVYMHALCSRQCQGEGSMRETRSR
jgi:hypothetical protein